jgi:hypothetical protein
MEKVDQALIRAAVGLQELANDYYAYQEDDEIGPEKVTKAALTKRMNIEGDANNRVQVRAWLGQRSLLAISWPWVAEYLGVLAPHALGATSRQDIATASGQRATIDT